MNLLPGTNSIVSRVYPQLFVLQTHLSGMHLHGRRAASGEFPCHVYTSISPSALPVPAKPLQNTSSVISGVRACSANRSAPTGNCVHTQIIGNVRGSQPVRDLQEIRRIKFYTLPLLQANAYLNLYLCAYVRIHTQFQEFRLYESDEHAA